MAGLLDGLGAFGECAGRRVRLATLLKPGRPKKGETEHVALTFRLARLDDPQSVVLVKDYEAELRRQGIVLDQQDAGGVGVDELLAPNGAFLIAELDGSPAACGGVRRLGEPGIAEVKRMYVAPFARRRGVGATLLGRLEDEARSLGCHVVRLDTGAGMEPALALYRRAGYCDIEDYNANPHAAYWMEKTLER